MAWRRQGASTVRLGRFPVLDHAGRDHHHVEHHLAQITGGAQLCELVGLGLLDLGASFSFGPGHDVKRHSDDLARLDPLSEAPLTLGLEPCEGRIEFISMSSIQQLWFRGLFERLLLLPGG